MSKSFSKVIKAVLLAAALPALAHRGGRDIRGTIVKFDRQAVVVKRLADGKTESVPLASSTAYWVGSVAGEWSSMRAGSRVVVHIGHDGKAIEIRLPAQK